MYTCFVYTQKIPKISKVCTLHTLYQNLYLLQLKHSCFWACDYLHNQLARHLLFSPSTYMASSPPYMHACDLLSSVQTLIFTMSIYRLASIYFYCMFYIECVKQMCSWYSLSYCLLQAEEVEFNCTHCNCQKAILSLQLTRLPRWGTLAETR